MDYYGLKKNVQINDDHSQDRRVSIMKVKLINEFGKTFSLNKSSSANKLNTSGFQTERKSAMDQKTVQINSFRAQPMIVRRSNQTIEGISPSRDQNKMISNNSFSPISKQRQSIKIRKQILVQKTRQLPIHLIYSERLDLQMYDGQIQRHFQNLSNNINNLLKYINNKKQVYKLLNRLLENYNSIKILMLNVETEELLEPLNVPELNKRLLEKSYNIYHFLLEEVKMQKNDNRLSFCFINHLQIVSEKISELYQQKVEEKMVIMSDNIIKEWSAVQHLHAKLVSNQAQSKNLNLNFDYNYDTLPLLNESDKLETLEVLHGQLTYISKQQRSYNKKIYEVLSKVRLHNNKHNFNVDASR